MQERLINVMKDQNEEIMPLLTRILVKVDKVIAKTEGGILLPEQVRDRESVALESGTVMEVGINAFQGYGDGQSQVDVGDHVYFLRHAGQIRKIGEDDYRILNDADLLAIAKSDYLKKHSTTTEE